VVEEPLHVEVFDVDAGRVEHDACAGHGDRAVVADAGEGAVDEVERDDACPPDGVALAGVEALEAITSHR
jgi:hypothetical protein